MVMYVIMYGIADDYTCEDMHAIADDYTCEDMYAIADDYTCENFIIKALPFIIKVYH